MYKKGIKKTQNKSMETTVCDIKRQMKMIKYQKRLFRSAHGMQSTRLLVEIQNSLVFGSTMSIQKVNFLVFFCRKRQAAEDDFDSMFSSALQLDTDDCAKLMVCHVFEKPAEALNSFESKIQKLFAPATDKIDAQSARAEYQLAAYVGGLKQAGLCQQRYSKCLVNPQQLTNINL